MSKEVLMVGFCVKVYGLSEKPTILYIAAKSRSQAKFHVASLICDEYFGCGVNLGICFGYIKSVKRAYDFDSSIDQRRKEPREIFARYGDGQ